MTKEFSLIIDDTGFNATKKFSETLQNEISTCTGVIIPNNMQKYLNIIMGELQKNLEKKFNTNEFHFTDIYNRKGPFKNIEIDETLQILDTFAQLFSQFDLKIATFTTIKNQTTQAQILMDEISIVCKNMELPQNEKSQTLMMTYLYAKKYLGTKYDDAKITNIICDEGIRKAGFNEKFADSVLTFEKSSENSLLQLADFSAWMLTRSKHILDKASKNENLSEIDKSVLSIFSKFSDNYINLKKIKINLNKPNKINYDKLAAKYF